MKQIKYKFKVGDYVQIINSKASLYDFFLGFIGGKIVKRYKDFDGRPMNWYYFDFLPSAYGRDLVGEDHLEIRTVNCPEYLRCNT